MITNHRGGKGGLPQARHTGHEDIITRGAQITTTDADLDTTGKLVQSTKSKR
jgi:hypothetical protein